MIRVLPAQGAGVQGLRLPFPFKVTADIAALTLKMLINFSRFE